MKRDRDCPRQLFRPAPYPRDAEQFMLRIVSEANTPPQRVLLIALQDRSLHHYLTVDQWITVIERINNIWHPSEKGVNLIAGYIQGCIIPQLESEAVHDENEDPAWGLCS